jgi:hypothetical protein
VQLQHTATLDRPDDDDNVPGAASVNLFIKDINGHNNALLIIFTRCLPRFLHLPTQRRLFCQTYQPN